MTFRLIPGLVLVVIAHFVPMTVAALAGTGLRAIERTGPDDVAMALLLAMPLTIAILYGCGRVVRRVLWKNPLTDANFILPAAMLAGRAIYVAQHSGSPVASLAWALVYAVVLWLGARGGAAQPLRR